MAKKAKQIIDNQQMSAIGSMRWDFAMSQLELGKLTGVSKAMISMFETNKRKPIGNAHSILDLLKSTSAKFLDTDSQLRAKELEEEFSGLLFAEKEKRLKKIEFEISRLEQEIIQTEKNFKQLAHAIFLLEKLDSSKLKDTTLIPLFEAWKNTATLDRKVLLRKYNPVVSARLQLRLQLLNAEKDWWERTEVN